jgi:hypothetical protein
LQTTAADAAPVVAATEASAKSPAAADFSVIFMVISFQAEPG